jgi:DNA-binding IscR family transcriptional regulator
VRETLLKKTPTESDLPVRIDSRLSRMLHVMMHMAHHDRPLTSDQIASMLATNPVVVRRTMAGLRNHGYVRSISGQGGGWSIACDLKTTTLLDIHRAVGGPHLFAIGIDNQHPDCAVERSVNIAVHDALKEAETLILKRLGQITLAKIAASFSHFSEIASLCDR